MITCSRCNNETWASELQTANGPVMLAGPRGSQPQPIVARVCTACGYVELFGPQPIDIEAAQPALDEPEPIATPAPVPVPNQ